jgi:hypothetical protein
MRRALDASCEADIGRRVTQVEPARLTLAGGERGPCAMAPDSQAPAESVTLQDSVASRITEPGRVSSLFRWVTWEAL